VTDRGLKNQNLPKQTLFERHVSSYHKLTAKASTVSVMDGATSDDHFLFGNPTAGWKFLQDPRVIQGREDINRPAFGYQGMAGNQDIQGIG